MMNKKKLCIIIVIAIIVTGLAVTFAVLSKSGKHKENVNEETTVNNEKQTDSVEQTTKADEKEQVKTSVTMQFKQSNSWEGNGRFYAQYDLIIDNKEDVKISDWTFKIILPMALHWSRAGIVQLILRIYNGVSCRLIIIR